MSTDPGNEAAASLAFATQLMQGMAQPQGPDGATDPSQAPETALEQGENPEGQPDDLNKQFDDFKKEIKQDIKDEIGQVKDMVKEALNEDEKD